MRVGDGLRQGLGEIERRQHVAEQHGSGDDHQNHAGLARGVAQNDPPFLHRPHAVDDDGENDAERCADAGCFRRRRHAAIEHVHHADDDGDERRDLRDRLEFFLPAVAEIYGVGTEAALPDDEYRPQHEKAGQHQARDHAGKKEPADRGFGGDAVEDEGD